jgi:AraC-like DNA-binding protein
MDTFIWPLRCFPVPVLAGRFSLADEKFATRYCGRAHALHLHDYRGTLRIGGGTIELSPGDLTISPAGVPNAYHLPAPGRHWCIHFEPAPVTEDFITLPLHLPLGAVSSAAAEQFAHVARLLSGARATDRARASLALQELLLWTDEQQKPSTPRTTAAERAAALIDRRFHEQLTVPQIAAAVGTSQAHLARSFRRRFGVTVPHRLVQRRITHARYLLESTDLPVWRVAERVGMPNAQHFNKAVRKLLGSSPSAIRTASDQAARIDPDR